MAQSRLRTALADGGLALPDGEIAVVRPDLTYDIAALPRDRVRIVHTVYPEFAAWRDAGFDVSQNMPTAKVAIVVVPRSKLLARALVTQACTLAELIVVDGQKTNGADSLFKACRKRLGDIPCVTKGHGRIFWFDATNAFADWAPAPVAKGAHGYFTTAGVFSDGAIDAGSALLAQALPEELPARMADLGAGWGYLSSAVLERAGVVSLDLVEAEALSLDCAKRNITDARARFHWDDATRYQVETGFDGIVMNPPFHDGRAADPALGRAFIQAAARLLVSHGSLWMVANRHLPYEQTLNDCFRNVDVIGGNGGFKLFHAKRPVR